MCMDEITIDSQEAAKKYSWKSLAPLHQFHSFPAMVACYIAMSNIIPTVSTNVDTDHRIILFLIKSRGCDIGGI